MGDRVRRRLFASLGGMTSPSESAEGSRLRRALARVAASTGLGLVFVASLAGGVILHLDLPAARRQVERFVRQALDGTFEGTVEARGFDHVGLDGIAVREIVVHDPAGIEVMRAEGTTLRASVPTLARSFLGSGDLRIGLPFLRIERLDALVEPNAEGDLGIATAFNPRATGEPEGPGRPLHVTLAHAEIGAIHARGKPDGAHAIDADLRGVAGSVTIDPGLLAIDLAPASLVERKVLARPIEGAAHLHVRVVGPKDAGDTAPSKTSLWGSVAGRAGDVGVVASALVDGDHVEAAAAIPRVEPEQGKALYSAYPVLDAASATATARGDLPRLDVKVIALTDRRGAAVALGRVDLGEPIRADLTFATSALDPRAASEGAPAVLVTSRGQVHAEVGERVSLRIDAQTDPTSLEGTPIPAVDATATFDGSVWTGSAHVHEPGAPIRATFATREDGAVTFDALAEAPRLADVPRLGKAHLRGAASVHASGVVAGDVLEAKIDGRVSDLRVRTSATVDRAAVRGRLHGPVSRLAIDATVHAADVFAAGYALDDAVVRISGPVERPRVRAHVFDAQRNEIELAAVVDPAASSASRVTLRVSREGVTTEGEIARVKARNGGLALDGVALRSEQLGIIDGSLAIAGGELLGDLHAERVDLGSLRKVLGLQREMEGRADIDVHLARAKGGRKGSIHLALEGGAGAVAKAIHLRGVTAKLDATFDGDRIQTAGFVSIAGTGDRCSAQIARLRVDGGDARIDGPLLSAKAWETAHGAVTIAAEDWDLGCLAEVAPLALPVTDIFGIASAKVSVERAKGQRFPSIRSLGANTRYLSFAARTPPEPGKDGPAETFASRDLDVELQGSLDGETGAAKLDFSLWDDSLLTEASVSATLDLAALVDPRRRTAALAATPVAGHVTVPRRGIETLRSLPSTIREKLPSLTGEIALDAYASGTVARPHVVVRARGFSIAPGPSITGEENPWATPTDVDTALAYDGKTASLDAHILHETKEIAVADATVTAPMEKVLAGGDALTSALRGEASLTLDGLPLANFPYLARHDVRGTLHGTAKIEGLGAIPKVDVQLSTRMLTVGQDLLYPLARVTVRTQGHTAADQTALATVRFADRTGGTLDATGYVSVAWKNGLVPSLRQDRPADLYANLRRFRLATAEPFLGGAVRRLDGFVDGGVRVGWVRVDPATKPTLDVDLRVADTTLFLSRLGQELRIAGDGQGPVHIRADRTGEIRVDPIIARGVTGRMTGSAIAHLDGLSFKDASAKLTIGESEPLPVTLEGVDQGSLWGTITVQARRAFATGSALGTLGVETLATLSPRKDRLPAIAIDVRSNDLHFKIPSSSSRDVQSLEANPDVVVLQDRAPAPEPPPKDPLAIAITTRIENMSIEGDGIRITLSTFEKTPPTIVVTDRPRGTGDVRLLRGQVEVVGRKFELDQGTVHLQSDVANPYLDVTAHWNAPDGSTIYVDYNGVLFPITQDKLRFRSDPPRTQQQSLAMLLFGSETGGALTTATNGEATSGGDIGSTVGRTATSLGGELAAAQFNALLKGIAPLKGLSTRFGSTDAGGVKTSLVYEVGDTLSAVATYEGGAPSGSPGSSTTSGGTSTTAPGASVSIDWRFYKNWLIRASVGTSADIPKGEVDLLWQYRY